jgi:hypothetical protein
MKSAAELPPPVALVAKRIATRHGCTVDEMLGGRSRRPSRARLELIRLVIDSWDLTCGEAAAILGIHHSTASIHRRRMAKVLRPRDP